MLKRIYVDLGVCAESGAGTRPPTLNIFPSQPMHVEPSKV
jgi:hypothetical protein